MKTFTVDENNDFVLNKRGDLSFCYDAQAVARVCKHYALAIRKEMIHKMNKGMPYFEVVFGKQVNLFQFEAAFRSRMREIEQVKAVVSFDARVQDGVLQYNALIKTIYGEVEIQDAL